MNPLYRMYTAFSRYWDTMVPAKPRYGNYHLRGKNVRWRKLGCPVVMILALAGCQYNNKPSVVNSDLYYFRDNATGLCFAAINSTTAQLYRVTSITCVPCDSIKNVIK